MLIIQLLIPITGLKPHDIVEFFNQVNGQAEKIKQQFPMMSEIPWVTVSDKSCKIT